MARWVASYRLPLISQSVLFDVGVQGFEVEHRQCVLALCDLGLLSIVGVDLLREGHLLDRHFIHGCVLVLARQACQVLHSLGILLWYL